jgi:hypothetical protein
MRNAHKILVGKSKVKRPFGRPRSTCDGNNKMNLKTESESLDYKLLCDHCLLFLLYNMPSGWSKKAKTDWNLMQLSASGLKPSRYTPWRHKGEEEV